MSTPYTPTPAPLPATLDLPEDGVEAVQVETVNTNTAAIADAVKNCEDDIDSTETDVAAAMAALRMGAARFYVTAATYANDAFYELTVQERTAPSDGYPTIVAQAIGGGGSAIAVDAGNLNGPSVGWWRVSIDICEIDLGADIVTNVEVWLFDAAASSNPTTGSVVAEWDTVKRTGSGDSASLIGEYEFWKANDATRIGIGFRVDAVGGHVVSGTQPTLRARVHIQQTTRVP